MKDKETTYTNVRELTDCLMRLERYLEKHADDQIYCDELNDWKSDTQEVLSKIISKANGIIKELTNEQRT